MSQKLQSFFSSLSQHCHQHLPGFAKYKTYYYIGGFLILNKIFKQIKKATDKPAPKNCILELDLDETNFVNYSVPNDDKSLRKLLKYPVKYDFLELLETLQKAKDEKNIKGVLIKFGTKNSGLGFSQIEELRFAIQQLRKAGKQVIAYSDTIGYHQNGILQYLLASACDKIFMNPMGMVNLISIQGDRMFAKQMLDKLGIKFELYRRKNYKGFLNVLNNEKIDEYETEQVNQLFDYMYNTIKSYITEDRKLTQEQSEQIFKNGPYLANEGKEMGLIDDIKYRDEVYEYVEKELFKDEKLNFLFLTHYMGKLSRPLLKKNNAKNKVVIMNLVGPIMDGKSKTPDIFHDELEIGAQTVTQWFRKAYNDKSVKAIIMRVDSPGGSALGSELINKEVQNAQKKGIKVIAVYSNVSASGGVYISTIADKVICSPLTITGSIGIISGHFNFREMWQKIGIRFDKVVQKDGKEQNVFSVLDDTTEDDKKHLNKFLDYGYEQFKAHVAKGRKMTMEEVEEIAQGRVWFGQEGKDRKIIDLVTQNPYLESLEIAAEMIGQQKKSIQYVVYPEKQSPIQQLLANPAQNEREKDKQAIAGSNGNGIVNFKQFIAGYVFSSIFGKNSTYFRQIFNQLSQGQQKFSLYSDVGAQIN